MREEGRSSMVNAADWPIEVHLCRATQQRGGTGDWPEEFYDAQSMLING